MIEQAGDAFDAVILSPELVYVIHESDIFFLIGRIYHDVEAIWH